MANILEVRNLVQHFDLTKGFLDRLRFENGLPKLVHRVAHAVNGISFDIREGEVFSLVGESGCGKSTAARTIIRLLEPKAGTIAYRGLDITKLARKEMIPLRREMQMIFQDPYASLNPRQRVRDIVMEPMLFHRKAKNRKEAAEKSLALLERVGLNPEQALRYPHQFSGGQRQRIGIARALAMEPRFIIADEPVSALDVSIQAQILNMLMDLKEEYQLSFLFIAHDLSVVKHISDSVGVMYLGSIVETGRKENIFRNPRHPYTRLLFSSAPTLDEEERCEPAELKGEIPSSINLPKGCAFCERCPMAVEICAQERPVLKEVEPGHSVSCHCMHGDPA
ncbi:MAG TPA: ATP-binding cassette domain-containing protein [Holophaga sp.]|nr:ATP-binding cassette domain-containing protein [Holophaga sp.]